MDKEEKDEETQEEPQATNEAEQEAVAEESQEEEEGEEDAEEKEEEKADEAELPELTDEQVAALRDKDERFKQAPSDLDAFLREALQQQEQTKEQEQAQAAQRQSLEDARKAYREDNDPAPLAQLADEMLVKAEEAEQLSAKLDEAMQEQLRPYVEAVYGEQIRSMKREEVERLSDMPLVDALKELDRMKGEAVRGESAGEVDAAKKAAQNAAAAANARSETGANLPGGSAKEAVGDDIGTLMRQGMGEEDLDVEEAQGG